VLDGDLVAEEGRRRGAGVCDQGLACDSSSLRSSCRNSARRALICGLRAQRFNGSHGQGEMTDNCQVDRRMIGYRLFSGGWPADGSLARSRASTGV
jgi:hypothetical protein